MNLLEKLFVSAHKGVYRLSGGRLGSSLAGIEHLLLTTVGRKSGQRREHPLACFEVDDALLIVASKGGADTSPAWYLNLCASPQVEIQRRRLREPRIARTANAAERARFWPDLIAQNPMYARYETRTTREIPVVVLERPPA